MGNGITKNPCFSSNPYAPAVASDPLPDDSHGHSFTYMPSGTAFDQPQIAAISLETSESSRFYLYGAAISANPVTLASMPSFQHFNAMTWPLTTAPTFESSQSFNVVPLQAALPMLSMSGPVQIMSGQSSETSGSASTTSNSPFRLGPLDHTLCRAMGHQPSVSQLSVGCRAARSHLRDERSPLRFFTGTTSKLRIGSPRYGCQPQEPTESIKVSFNDRDNHPMPNDNVEWAQGMAGEDRFHVAVSEEHGWVFVGIYDGFNGPDATDFLFANLYVAVHGELKGILWDDIQRSAASVSSNQLEVVAGNAECLCLAQADGDSLGTEAKRRQAEVPMPDNNFTMPVHREVMRALARALKKTEEAFFVAAEEQADKSPELGLMGSCVLVMVMKGSDVYIMNVGDSRAVLARRPEPDLKNVLGKAPEDLQQFKAEIMRELKAHDMDGLQAVQLSADHSTTVQEEVLRIKGQHLNDRQAIVNGRVKGKINVTRAFGVAYLKQPKWNNRLLGAFKINYVGTEPYVTCTPSLCHHRIVGSQDKFLVLSSDGLYEFFTNKEVVDQLEAFTATEPDGDPAHHLVGELVNRAARKAGMTARQLLNIRRGERRHYHDDVSIIVISFKGQIWRSSV